MVDFLYRYRSLFRLVIFLPLIFLSHGCCGPLCQMEGLMKGSSVATGEGGGEDSIVIDLPFGAGEDYQCVQGAGGDYSHSYNSTLYDLDFDTPNDRDVAVFAPVGGLAYLHDDGATSGFGTHLNLDQGDGSYIILAHLSDVFVESGEEVAAGQFLAFEGTTGASTGDHVHIGRHSGNADESGGLGTSVAGLQFRMEDRTTSTSSPIAVESAVCDLSSGHYYRSQLASVSWHPDGTLIMEPNSSTVYRLDDGTKRAFLNETAFLSRNYSWDDVVVVTQSELDCYPEGDFVEGEATVSAVVESEGSGTAWLVVEYPDDGVRLRYELPDNGWQGVLKTWGIEASTYDDLGDPADLPRSLSDYTGSGTAPYRDGALVSAIQASDVYVVDGGQGRPIESWDAYLMLGFWPRTVVEVDQSELSSILSGFGSCRTGAGCITQEAVATCGYEVSDYSDPSETSSTTPPDTEPEDETDPVEDDSVDLALTWISPSVGTTSIKLEGELTDPSLGSIGWQTFDRVKGTDRVSHTFGGVTPGTTLRFSVEYVAGGVTSWSCLAPFPPGTVQGSIVVTSDGRSLSVSAVDDPTSDGCGLLVTVPE